MYDLPHHKEEDNLQWAVYEGSPFAFITGVM